jgi:hypothetical protein
MRRIVIAIFAGLVVTAIAGGACHSSGLERELVSRIRLEWELPEYIAIPIAGFVVPAYIGLILAALVAYRRPALPVTCRRIPARNPLAASRWAFARALRSPQ